MSNNRKPWEIAQKKVTEAYKDIGHPANCQYADYFNFNPEEIILDGHFTVDELQIIIKKWKEYKQETDHA